MFCRPGFASPCPGGKQKRLALGFLCKLIGLHKNFGRLGICIVARHLSRILEDNNFQHQKSSKQVPANPRVLT